MGELSTALLAFDGDRKLQVVALRNGSARGGPKLYYTLEGKRRAAGELSKLDRPLSLRTCVAELPRRSKGLLELA